MSPQNLYGENLISKVMVLRGRVFERGLGYEGGALRDEISALTKGGPESSLTPSPSGDTTKLCALEKGSNPTTLAP